MARCRQAAITGHFAWRLPTPGTGARGSISCHEMHREPGTSVGLQQQAAHKVHAWLCQPELVLLRRRKPPKTRLAFGIHTSPQSPKLAMYLRVTDSPNPSLKSTRDQLPPPLFQIKLERRGGCCWQQQHPAFN